MLRYRRFAHTFFRVNKRVFRRKYTPAIGFAGRPLWESTRNIAECTGRMCGSGIRRPVFFRAGESNSDFVLHSNNLLKLCLVVPPLKHLFKAIFWESVDDISQLRMFFFDLT